jgi:hypothetical protein
MIRSFAIRSITRGHAAGLGILALMLGIASPALPQDPSQPGDPQAVAEPHAVPRGETRPAFVLPDVVVEGEDLSQLTGGLRLLELEVPNVSPQQKPLLVTPRSTGYRRRTIVSFRPELPPAAAAVRLRGLLRVAAEQGPGGSASLAYLPEAARPGLLWCDLRGWTKRVADHEQLEGSAGWFSAAPADDPHWRLGLAMRGLTRRWEPGPADSALRVLQASGFVEGRAHLLGGPAVVGLGLEAADARASWSDPAGGRSDEALSGRWAVADLGVTTGGSTRDLRRPRTSLAVDVRGGVIFAESPEQSQDAHPECRGHIAWRIPLNNGRVDLGLGGGGTRDEYLFGPHLVHHWRWQDNQLQMHVTVGPEVTYARELLLPGGGLPSYVTAARYAPKLTYGGLPAAMRRPGDVPGLAVVDPQLPPQRAWPRVAFELLVRREFGYLQAKASVAELKDPLSWRRVSSPSAPSGAVYRTASLADRWLTRLEAQGYWRFGKGSELRVAYAWTHDAEHASGQALLFVPEHELFAALDVQTGRILWGAGLHCRDKVSAGDGAPELDAFFALSGSVGWRFANGRLMLIAENLLNEEIVHYPGEGLGERWLRLAWEQSFHHSVP